MADYLETCAEAIAVEAACLEKIDLVRDKALADHVYAHTRALGDRITVAPVVDAGDAAIKLRLASARAYQVFELRLTAREQQTRARAARALARHAVDAIPPRRCAVVRDVAAACRLLASIADARPALPEKKAGRAAQTASEWLDAAARRLRDDAPARRWADAIRFAA